MNEIQGLVLSSIDYKEKSKIVYLYTPYGHDSVKANHSKELSSGLLGFTTTLNEVMYVKSAGKFPTLIEYHLLESYYSLTESISKIHAVHTILEVIKGIPEDTDHAKVYSFIMHTLRDLKENDAKKVLSVFLIKMLYVFGVTPNLRQCLRCNRNEIVFFSIFEGGGYCSNCSTTENIQKYKIWKEYYYEKKAISEYSEIEYDSLLEDIYKYYAIHVHLELTKFK